MAERTDGRDFHEIVKDMQERYPFLGGDLAELDCALGAKMCEAQDRGAEMALATVRGLVRQLMGAEPMQYEDWRSVTYNAVLA